MKSAFTFLISLLFIQTLVSQIEENFEGQLTPKLEFKPNIEGIDGQVEVVFGEGYNSNYGVRMGKYSDGNLTKNGIDISLGNVESHTYLFFNIKDRSEENHSGDGILFSNDGGQNFVPVYTFKPEDWCDNRWGAYPPFHINLLAESIGMDLSNTNDFVIRIQQQDDSDFVSGGDADGLVIDNLFVYSSPPEYAVLPFVDNFNNASNGQFGPSWRWSHADSTMVPLECRTKPTGFVGIDGSGGEKWAVMGKICDDGLTANALDLCLNLEGKSDVFLSFSISDNREENHEQDGLFFSNDGGQSFRQVYTFKPEDWCDNRWGAFPPFSVDRLAESVELDLTDRFVIRFQQYDDSDFVSGGDADGIIIDNVSVYSAPPLYGDLPFEDNFDNTSNGQFGPNWRWSHADSTMVPLECTTKPTGFVGIVGTTDKWAAFGKIDNCDDGPTANALDLHLDLKDKSDVFLSFSINDNREENHEQDGLFFSNDGGQSFRQVYTFKPEDWCDNRWGAFPPFSVDRLAESVELDLTDRFVIRFQQYDDSDFVSGGDADGIIIDNVSVYSAPPLYGDLPFEDNFDNTSNGQFGPNWRWSHADSTIMPLECKTKPTGFVGIVDGTGTNNSKGTLLGKINNCDDGLTANALDLHLNLENCANVILSFELRDFFEEKHLQQDGLFFSNDGGENFERIVSFNFDSIPDSPSWNSFSIDLDTLVGSVVNLTYSDKCVIRFQQYDDSDFISGGDADGYIIDNINVQCDFVSNIENQNFLDEIKIYPNPIDDKLIIEFNDGIDNGEIKIYNLQGKLVACDEFKNRKKIINTSSLQSGIYLIRISTKEYTMKTYKLIKK